MIRFRLFQTDIELHGSVLILLSIVILSGNCYFAAASALFSLIHELVHKAVAVKLGYKPERIVFGLFGGVLMIREGFIKPRHELLIHLSGPFFNIAAAVFLYGLYFYFYLPVLVPAILANVILALYNLMPFYPLDGGKILELYLAAFFGYGRARSISRIFSLILIVFLFLLGIYLVQYNVLNLLFSVLACNLYLVREQENGYIFYKITRNLEAAEWTCDSKICVCREDHNAAKMIKRYKPQENRLFTIVDDKGIYKGQLTEQEFINAIYYCGIYATFEKLLASKRGAQNQSL